MGAYRSIVAMAPPDDRAGLITAIYVVGYLATGVPAVIAGIATSRYGLHDTALVYSLIVAALATAAGGGFLIRRTRASGGRDIRSPILDESPPGMSEREQLRMKNLGEDLQTLHDAGPGAVEERVPVGCFVKRVRVDSVWFGERRDSLP